VDEISILLSTLYHYKVITLFIINLVITRNKLEKSIYRPNFSSATPKNLGF